MQASTIAAHRFGFSEANLQALQGDPRGWVMAQFRTPAPFDSSGLPTGPEAGQLTREALATVLTGVPGVPGVPATPGAVAATRPRGAAGTMDGGNAALADMMSPGGRFVAPPGIVAPPALQGARLRLRDANQAGLQRRWKQVVTTSTPVYERWVMFWANHFCVAATKGATLGMVWPHEREAIRPLATGKFADMVRASTLHPGMLLYLDNAQSIGPDSKAGQRRKRGLNENLARELLELHTVGVHGGYTQADVTELAKLLTGWSVTRTGLADTEFTPALHQPGPKTVMGKVYPEGPQAVDQLFVDLSRHPSTSQYIAGKLVRHFVSDEPPAALVDAVAARFRDTDGDLMAVADTLFGNDLAWSPDTAQKFKRPEELVLSAHRMLGVPIAPNVAQANRLTTLVSDMGQPPGRPPSPQGWPDRNEDWLATDSLWKRITWAASFGAQSAAFVDARQLAVASLGPDLAPRTRDQIARAETGGQALALLLSSPDFQRR